MTFNWMRFSNRHRFLEVQHQLSMAEKVGKSPEYNQYKFLKFNDVISFLGVREEI